MNSIGNDNYRPGMKPPEAIKGGGGWLSSNMAQLMVFINGLILTITAFATLSVFIDEIVQDGLQKTSDDIEQYIISEYTQTHRSLKALSTVVSMSPDSSVLDLKKYLKENSSGAGHFDDIYWVYKNDTNAWQVAALTQNKNYLDRFKEPAEFVTFIQMQMKEAVKPMRMIPSLPYIDQKQQGENQSIYDRYVAIVDMIGEAGAPFGYLVGITNFYHVLDADYLAKKLEVQSIQIVDTKSDLPLYSYRLDGKNTGNISSHFTKNFTYPFVDREVEVVLNLSVQSRESFLQKIPFLMLLFGITLTLIGTLYVRNNQSQSQKLSSMNKELAHKNFELNQEITERERLNHVIQQSERENRAIINAVSDIIFEISTDGRILFLNESWEKVTGFERERSIGRNLFDLIHVQDQESQRQSFDQLVSGQKKSYRVFTRLRSADGNFRAIELALSMLRQDENQDMRAVGTITDVEERRRAERALSEAEKKYRAIVENAAGGIYQVTPDGQFLSANPALAKIIGYESPEEVLRDVINSQDQLYVDSESRIRFLRDLAMLDISKNFEGQVKRKDGSMVWVSENIRPVKDDEGTLLFYEGSMEDVDQRRKAEIALKEAKIESDLANRAKSEFLANMSHELRTPLNSVIGFSEIIKNEAFGSIAQEEYKEYATNIHDSGNNLLNVINEILDVSRIDAGERTLNEGVIKISEVVDSCLGMVEGKLRANRMRVENKVKGSGLSFVGESHAFKQMLLNLMTNAIKFSPAQGFLMLDAETGQNGRLRVSVTDTGIGMSEEELEKALTPFGQVETEHNRSKSGTGLGLTLVKSLVELHGGALDIVSQKNIGTTATLIFPAKRVAGNKADKNKDKDINVSNEMKDA